VLLADAQTVGGYPKIATVISADLPRIAQARPGQTLRFAAVDAAGARAALADLRARWQAWAATLVAGLPPGEVDEAALWSSNLVDGVVDCHHWDTR
jgi:allophanate hydrolase